MKFLMVVIVIRAVAGFLGKMFTRDDAVIAERDKRKIIHPSEFWTRW
jgi:hypothetical protein